MEDKLGLEKFVPIHTKGLEGIASKPTEVQEKTLEYKGLNLIYERKFEAGTSIKYWM